MPAVAKVLCGNCKVAPELVENENGEVHAVCPGCGQTDKSEDAARIAGEHFTDAAAHVLQSNQARAARNNKFMTYEAKPVRKRTFRWHAV